MTTTPNPKEPRMEALPLIDMTTPTATSPPAPARKRKSKPRKAKRDPGPPDVARAPSTRFSLKRWAASLGQYHAKALLVADADLVRELREGQDSGAALIAAEKRCEAAGVALKAAQEAVESARLQTDRYASVLARFTDLADAISGHVAQAEPKP